MGEKGICKLCFNFVIPLGVTSVAGTTYLPLRLQYCLCTGHEKVVLSYFAADKLLLPLLCCRLK